MIADTTALSQDQDLQASTESAYDATVRADIELFRSYAEKFMAGQLSVDDFRAQRLRRGVYTQRQEGVHMIRTKVPGGMLTAAQMDRLAAIADEFAGGKGHLTTRQNMQYHFIPLPKVADLLHRLADVRMTTREACYNTVRNVTACPLSGLLEDEVSTCILMRRKLLLRSCIRSSPIACPGNSRLRSRAAKKTACWELFTISVFEL